VRGRRRLTAAADAVRDRPRRLAPAGRHHRLAADLPGTGANLQDHPVGPSPAGPPRRLCLPAGTNHGEMYAGDPQPARRPGGPDLHLFPILLPAAPHGLPARLLPGSRWPAPWSPRRAPALSGWPHPTRGPAPLIDPGFLTEPSDTVRAAGRAGAESAAPQPPPGSGPPQTLPPAVTGAELRGLDPGPAVGSYWHPAGTCRTGTGPDAGDRSCPAGARHHRAPASPTRSVMPVIPQCPYPRDRPWRSPRKPPA